MTYGIILVVIICIIYYAGQTIKEKIETYKLGKAEFRRAYEIYQNYPHVLRNRLINMTVHVDEKTDMVEVMREKVNNNMVVEYFIDELDKSLSKREFKYIWNEISRRNFFYERHIQLSDLETDIRNDSKFLEEEKKREDQERELAIKEKKRLKDKYGDWF